MNGLPQHCGDVCLSITDFYQERKNYYRILKMIPTVNLVDDDLCRPSLYPEGTLVVKIWGPGSGTSHPPDGPAPIGRPDGSCSVHPASLEGGGPIPLVCGGPAFSSRKNGTASGPGLFLPN